MIQGMDRWNLRKLFLASIFGHFNPGISLPIDLFFLLGWNAPHLARLPIDALT
jgi:hypothetical protein